MTTAGRMLRDLPAAAFVFAALSASALPGIPRHAHAAIAPAELHAIAVAEDHREWNDGVLRTALTNADPEVRARAALAVGRLQDSTTVGALLPLLDDDVPAVREEAAFALGQIGHVSAREALEAKLGDTDHEVVALAIEALGKIGDHRSTARVADFLRDPDAALRRAGAVALWRLADSTVIGRLLERHDDPDPSVRYRVMYALEKINSPDQIVLIAALHQDDEDERVRAQAARTLGRQKSARATSYLLQMVDDPSVAVVINALRGLQSGADSVCAFCAPTITRMLSHSHPYVRLTAAQVLGDRFAWLPADSASERATIDSLRVHLADPDGATRAAAATALLHHLGEEAWPDVAPLMDDPSFYVRVGVLGAAGQLPGASFDLLLLSRLSWRTPLFERMTAALALGGRKDAGVAPILRAELYDGQLLYVAAVASALEQLGDSASVRSLATVYQAHAADADPDARIAIRDALRTLAGRAFADSVEGLTPTPAAAALPPDFGMPPRARRAILHTVKGDIEWAFYPDEAPQTVANFARLARDRYFDGALVHRVVPDFVIQDGDPTATGWGGPGYTIRCEYNRLRYEAGMVGMALSGKDTGGSQWFITQAPQPHLNGRYTIFARVTSGMDVVKRIVQGDQIKSVEIFE
jgi:cyclophilin family peptidyl-prolyl cis-trans isomerase/HEAT repeat protein